jgi:Putative zinc-finger
MKTCRELTEHASELVDGDVSGPEWDELRHHLDLCPPCGEYVRQLGLTVELLRQLPGPSGEATRAKLLELYNQWLATRHSSPQP